MHIRAGQRFRSTVCDTAVVVVRGGDEDLALRCGDAEMVLLSDDSVAPSGTPAAGHDEGTLIGKRYWEESTGVELMCTKGGGGSLSVGGALLTLKPAKPLPSSD